jgi:hypothetical protein
VGHPVDGQTHDDDDPTGPDVEIYLSDEQGGSLPHEQARLPVQANEYPVDNIVETEIKNKIVEAVTAWAHNANVENHTVGGKRDRHSKHIIISASVFIEE